MTGASDHNSDESEAAPYAMNNSGVKKQSPDKKVDFDVYLPPLDYDTTHMS